MEAVEARALGVSLQCFWGYPAWNIARHMGFRLQLCRNSLLYFNDTLLCSFRIGPSESLKFFLTFKIYFLNKPCSPSKCKMSEAIIQSLENAEHFSYRIQWCRLTWEGSSLKMEANWSTFYDMMPDKIIISFRQQYENITQGNKIILHRISR